MKHSSATSVVAGVVLAVVLFTLLRSEHRYKKDIHEQANPAEDSVDVTAEPDLYGLVKLVDVASRRLTLSIATEGGKEQEQTYHVAEDAEVLLEGPATLGQLTTGTRVGIVLGPGGKDVVAIRSEPFRIRVESKQSEVEVGKPFNAVLRVTNTT